MKAWRSISTVSLRPHLSPKQFTHFTSLTPYALSHKFATRPSKMASTTEAPSFEDKFAPRKRDHPSDSVSDKRQDGKPNQPRKGSNQQKSYKMKKPKRERNTTEASSEDVLARDIKNLLISRNPDLGELPTPDFSTLPAEGSEVDVEVVDISSTSDGLAMLPGDNTRVYTVPFTLPGDVARIKVFKHLRQEGYSIGDFISIVKPAPQRDDSRIKCRYFNTCGGCQFQMLSYEDQLVLKRRIVEKAFRNFSDLAPELVPAVKDTIGSPLQYGYRTKLTPHFDGPPGFNSHKRRGRGKNNNADRPGFEKCPDIGFMIKGRRQTMDIEECPIGTEVLNRGMTRERSRMQEEYSKYKAGSTILLRESTTRYPKDKAPSPEEQPPFTVRNETEDGESVDIKFCETNHKNITTEYIGKYEFTNPAGSFFQNNNSILPRFTSYVRDNILPAGNSASSPDSRLKYLIDAYSGSGLFTITLSTIFEDSIGIDIAADSIRSAGDNAKRNGLEGRCKFIAADAKELFKSVTYNADQTVVVLDPPRKGCDNDFLRQLREFGPKRVLYVSCNVHTQARDVGYLVRGEGGAGARYEIESLVGFDFFPQTGHVEGVAILNRVAELKE